MEGECDSPPETVNCIVCTICETTFKLRKSLYRHLRNFHKIEPLSKKEPQFECETCDKTFLEKKNFNKHLRNHIIEPLIKKEPQFKCETCEQNFSSKGNLNQHAQKFHGLLQQLTRKTRLTCCFQDCDLKFMNLKQYRIHLKKDHKLNLETEELCFGSIQEFEHWKKDMESQSLALYTQDTAKTTLANGNIKIYYNCHRSLKYICKGKNKRASKYMGSNKINYACPARLDVEVVNDKSKVIVKFYKTHCGHETQIGRIKLDKNTRAQIADKLREGFTFEHILDSVRDHDSHLENGTLERISLLDRKDLHNIVRDFKIDYKTKRHQNKSIDAVKLARDNYFSKLIKLSKKHPVIKHQNVHKSHRASKNIKSEYVQTIEENKSWMVPSAKNCEEKYYVTKIQETCKSTCLKCTYCNICIHTFRCGCTDNAIERNICKHIHFCAEHFCTSSANNYENEILQTLCVKPTPSNKSGKECIHNKIVIIMKLLKTTDLDNEDTKIIENKLDQVIDILKKKN